MTREDPFGDVLVLTVPEGRWYWCKLLDCLEFYPKGERRRYFARVSARLRKGQRNLPGATAAALRAELRRRG